MCFELDHVFILTDVGAPEADRLRAFGLTEGEPNTHQGQGTANRRFFFQNAMLELLWVHDPEYAQSERTRPTHLWERWRGRSGAASPFGICLRPLHPHTENLPFPSWQYRPAYAPESFVLHVGDNSGKLVEPMLFYLPLVNRPGHAGSGQPVDHAAGLREITALRIHSTGHTSPSAALEAAVRTGAVTLVPATQQVMEIVFDGETRRGSMDFRPELPLVLKW